MFSGSNSSVGVGGQGGGIARGDNCSTAERTGRAGCEDANERANGTDGQGHGSFNASEYH